MGPGAATLPSIRQHQGSRAGSRRDARAYRVQPRQAEDGVVVLHNDLSRCVRPHNAVQDDGVGIRLANKLCHPGAEAGASAARHAGEDEKPGKVIAPANLWRKERRAAAMHHRATVSSRAQSNEMREERRQGSGRVAGNPSGRRKQAKHKGKVHRPASRAARQAGSQHTQEEHTDHAGATRAGMGPTARPRCGQCP